MKSRPIDYRARMAQQRAMQQNAARHNAPFLQHERQRILRDELRRLQAQLDAIAPKLAERRSILRDIVRHCDKLVEIQDDSAFFKELRHSPYFAKNADKQALADLEIERTLALIEESGLALSGYENLVYQSVNITEKAYPYIELVNNLLQFLNVFAPGLPDALDLPEGEQIETATSIFLGGKRIAYLDKIACFRLALSKAESQDLFQLERAVGEARQAVSTFRMRHGLL